MITENMLDLGLGILAILIVLSGLFMLIQGTTAMNDKK